jgi:hypothetical protein
VLEGVAQVDGFFDGGISLVAELFVFILQVCDQQVEFVFVHFMLLMWVVSFF